MQVHRSQSPAGDAEAFEGHMGNGVGFMGRRIGGLCEPDPHVRGELLGFMAR